MGEIHYPCVATTQDGFVQQLALYYLKNHYRYYVSGFIPEGKDPVEVDAKLIGKYRVAIDKWERHRRRKAGLANVQYLRHHRRFLLLATGPHGTHRFFEEERDIKDAREVPIRVGEYELSYRGGRVWVRIARDRLKTLRVYLLDIATRRTARELAEEFRWLPFEPYRPVRYQLFRLLEEVNSLRRRAGGMTLVPESAVRFKRRRVRVFEEGEEATKRSMQGRRASCKAPGGVQKPRG